MVLVDTSVWIEHFRHQQPKLADLLTDAQVLIHPFIFGELACGNFKNRSAILSDLGTLAEAIVAMHDEVLSLLDTRKLGGRGLGWMDVHLLASALLTHCRLWTLDKSLATAAADLRLK